MHMDMRLFVIVQFDLSEKQVGRTDGRIFCSFVRPVNTSITHIVDNHDEDYRDVTNLIKTFDLSDKLFIQIVWGTVYKGRIMLLHRTFLYGGLLKSRQLALSIAMYSVQHIYILHFPVFSVTVL